MGLSSSQARLLSLTGRMHDIEYKAQHLEAQKLQMANESRHVYQEYENALNATKIQLKQVNSDGMITWFDASVKRMKDAGYTVSLTGSDLYHASASEIANFTEANGNPDYFAALELHRVDATGYNSADGVYEIYNVTHLENMLSTMSSGKKYRLMSNIDASSVDPALLGKDVSGIKLDGNGYTISNLKDSLFGQVNGSSEIKNLYLNANITTSGTSSYQCGILAKKIYSSAISNVSVSGTINATGAYKEDCIIGGISGVADGVTFVNCSSDVAITTTDCRTVGGFIGQAYNNVKVQDSSSKANITVNGYGTMIGGFIGNTYKSTYTNVSSEAHIDTTNGTGGVPTGPTYKPTYSVGGFVGSIKGDADSKIENANVIGDITIGTDHTPNNGTVVGHGADGGTGGGHISVLNTYANVAGGDGTPSGKELINSYETTVNYTESPKASPNSITVAPPAKTTDLSAVPGYPEKIALYNKMAAGYVATPVDEAAILSAHENDTNWFTQMVNDGLLFMSKDDGSGKMYLVNVATDTNLQEVPDDRELKKAEAKYEADMRRIDAKDKKFDVDLAAIDNERNAIKTEMETLKTIAKDNVERTFKLFS